MDPAHHRPRRPAGRGGRHRSVAASGRSDGREARRPRGPAFSPARRPFRRGRVRELLPVPALARGGGGLAHRNVRAAHRDRKSTRLNSSHTVISYAVFCLKKKKKNKKTNKAKKRNNKI